MSKKSIYIFSRGEFIELPREELQNKAIIRIHSNRDKGWYDQDKYSNMLQVYFDDLTKENLKWYERWWCFHSSFIDIMKISASWSGQEHVAYPITYDTASEIIEFIKKNQKRDFVIHSEYGQSRSVAVGLFIKNNFGGILENKTIKECERANDWVLEVLEKAKD